METKTKKVVTNYKAKYEAATKEIASIQDTIDELLKSNHELKGYNNTLNAKYMTSVEKYNALKAEHESKCNDNAILSQMLDKATAQLDTIKASWWYKVAKFFGVWE